MATKPVLKTKWRDGPLVWELFDITIQGEEEYYHLRLVRGKHLFPDNRVVGRSWFEKKRSTRNKMWAGTPALSCDPVLVCAATKQEALQILRGTIYETEEKYFRGLFVRCKGTIERVACKNLTETGVWKVERNREYGLPRTASEYVPAKRYS